jgi:hypothetical protein
MMALHDNYEIEESLKTFIIFYQNPLCLKTRNHIRWNEGDFAWKWNVNDCK